MAESPTTARYVVLERRVQDTEQDIQEVKQDVQEVKFWMNGNGKPGAKTTLATFDQRLSSIECKLDKLEKAVTGLIVSVIGSVIVYILLTVIPAVAK